ncbi:MAG: sulfatase-like hydrolase/transferase [Gemmatimonadetes bacterium]|nr:sulfatase-like hydrolase/transferase [Gemmatimonadota bacterium]
MALFRRPWIVVATVLLVVAVIAAVVAAVKRPGAQADLRRIDRQNVLLITIDTLRADALSVYGGPARTPALDQLAADGVRFDFAHAHSVLTLPSHTSILTGQYPYEHGIRDNSGYRVAADTRTVSTLLKQAGYATSAFVAAFPLTARFGLNVGFDRYDDQFGDPNAPADFNMSERPASSVVPLARTWIAGAKGPWFSWVHVFDPHAPYRPPSPFDSEYVGKPYYGEVAAVDAALAPLLASLRAAPTPTLVIVTGDHGEGLGEHGEEAHGIFAYESTLRVPLIIAELGGSASAGSSWLASFRERTGEVSSVAARHVDILPTILDAIGQPVPTGLPGRTLLPAAERTAQAPARLTYFEAMSGMLNHGWAPLTGVVSGREKFIELPIPERYDLATDAHELVNLMGREPARDRALTAMLAQFASSLPGERATETADAAARLRALGYASGQAPVKAQYTEDDDPKRLVELDQKIHRALEAFSAGRMVEAEDLYKQVIDRRPDMAIAYRHIALIEWQAGNAATAIAVLQRALAKGVTEPRTIAQLGEYLSDVGNVADALKLLEPLGRAATADADTLNVLGITYARAGRSGDARRVFERLLVLLPGSSAPYENLGVLALQQGDLVAARQQFDRAVALAPTSSRAHAGVGAVAMQAGDQATAFAAWTRAVQLDAANFDALFSLGVNLSRVGRASEARPYLEQFQRTAPPALYGAQLREVARLLQ